MHINSNPMTAVKTAAPTKAAAKPAVPPSDCGCSHAAPQESVQLSSNPRFEPPKEDPPGQQPPQEPPGQQPPQEPPSANVQVTVYAQDPYVAKAEVMEIPRTEIGADLSSNRAVIRDLRPHATPDERGNYLLAEGSDGISQVNALVFTTDTLQLFEEYRGGSIPWATGGEKISITPHKQEGRNAYYSRYGGTNYFFSPSPGLNTVMKTSNSSDVVSHETGHALLDGIRPGFFSTHDDETGAFHEAFGDCAAMLMTLRNASNREAVLKVTGGDLRQHNVISSLAEEFGAARAFDNDDPSDDHKIWLRTALNDFTYLPPSQVPPGRGDDNNLGREVHSFSRLFSAAFYDVIESVYLKSVNDDKQSPQDALVTAERVTGPLLTRAIESGSPSRARYKEIALGMIAADGAVNGGKYSDGMKEVFLKRKIITPEDIQQSEQRLAELPDVRLPAGISRANAVDFLEANAEKLNIPSNENYIPDSVSTNERGETFVSYRFKNEVPVTVKGLEDKVTDVQGGVNLAFDASGQLSNFVFTPIDSNTVESEMNGIARMYANNAIVEKEILNLATFHGTGDTSVFKSAIEGNKIVRIPISGCDHGHDHAH